MKVSTALVSSLFAAALVMGGNAMAASGKVEAKEDRDITVGGQTYTISSKRTDVKVNGQAATRDDIEVGMQCEVEGEAGGEASKVDCKK